MIPSIPRNPALDGRGLVVSGHQPVLFGTDGYWSKLLVADLHIVTAGVPYRPGDHLGRLLLPDGGCVHLPTRRAGPIIGDLELTERPTRVMRAIEVAYMRRAYPYRERLNAVLAALDVKGPCAYLSVWHRVFHATLAAAGIPAPLTLTDIAEDVGFTTEDRQQRRLQRLAPRCGVYVSGPGARAYLKKPTWRPVEVHTMRDPSPLPFLHAIVAEENPASVLTRYTLEPL